MPGPDQIHHTADFSIWASLEPKAEVLQFAVVREKAHIGKSTRICSHVYVDKGVRIGSHCKIKNHVFICEGVVIGDQVFVGPGVMFLNDPKPRAYEKFGPPYPKTRVEARATIGARAVIFPGVTIGTGAMVGANATVLADVPAGATVVGVWKGADRVGKTAEVKADLPLSAEVQAVPAKATGPDRATIEAMTVKDIKTLLQEAGIRIPRRAKKAKLVDLYLSSM